MVSQLKYLKICIFVLFLGYYMYVEHILKNDAFFIFCHNFVTPILNLAIDRYVVSIFLYYRCVVLMFHFLGPSLKNVLQEGTCKELKTCKKNLL